MIAIIRVYDESGNVIATHEHADVIYQKYSFSDDTIA